MLLQDILSQILKLAYSNWSFITYEIIVFVIETIQVIRSEKYNFINMSIYANYIEYKNKRYWNNILELKNKDNTAQYIKSYIKLIFDFKNYFGH